MQNVTVPFETHFKQFLTMPTNPGYVEAFWRTLCARYSEFWILVVVSVSLHAIFYVITAIPAIVMPRLGFMDKYKIQKNRVTTWADVWRCLKLVILNQTVIEIPLYCILPLYTKWAGIPYNWESLPSMWTYAWKMVASLVLEDTYHYWMHRVLHWPSIYGKVHKIHHTYNSPFTMTAEFAHPIETIVLGVGFFIPVVLLCDHMIFLFVWLGIRMIETADVHCGYDFPLNPLRLLPGYGGPRMHDLHHAKTIGNYASTFTWWDNWMGTNIVVPDSYYTEQNVSKMMDSTGVPVTSSKKLE